MNGMDAVTGQKISGDDHIRQSVTDILKTPIGSRIMLRNYGSRLFDLIDRPINNQTTVELIAATAEALGQWEPRISLKKVTVSRPSLGHLTINIEYIYTSTGQNGQMQGIQL